MRKIGWLLLCGSLVACGDAAPDEERDDAAADDVVADSTSANVTQQTADDAGVTSVETYECSELRFTARIENATAFIELPDRTLQLPHSSTSTGSRYTDGSSTFWENNGRANLELPEGSHYDCERAAPADIPRDTLSLR